MVLDLHMLAEKASPLRKPFVIKEIGAFLQAWIIGFGSVGRFFCNECRRDENGVWPPLASTGGASIVAGALSYITALAIWIFTTWNLLHHVGPIEDVETEFGRRDATLIYVVALSQIGYPLVAFLQIMWLNFGAGNLEDAGKKWMEQRPMPGSQYSPWCSFLKDLAFAALDVTAKGGLALYCGLRATWLTSEW